MADQPEFIEKTTGGPKKYFRRKRVRNPLYQRPAEPVSKYPAKNYQSLIDQFRQARKALGLSQATLANQLGTHQAVISKFELGKTNPTLHFLTMLAKKLNKKLAITFKEP